MSTKSSARQAKVQHIGFVWVLILLTLATLVITIGLIVSIAYFRSKSALRVIEKDHYQVAVAGVANDIRQLLHPNASIVREFQSLFQRGLISTTDVVQIGSIFAERLRSPVCLTGLGMALGETGHYVGAARTPDGRLVVKFMNSNLAPGHQVERQVFPDGSFGPPELSESEFFDPRERPWYQPGLRAWGNVIWLRPYKFFGSQYGISAVTAIFGQNFRLIGVLSADFSLQAIQHALATLLPKQHRLLFLVMQDVPITQSSTLELSLTRDLREYCMSENLPQLQGPAQEVSVRSFKWKGVEYVSALTEFLLNGQVECRVGLVVRESDFLDVAKKNIIFAMEVGTGALLIAIVIATILSTKLARPLSQISQDLERVAQFKIEPALISSSPLYEVQALVNATQHMKQGIQSFARYVPDYVVRKLLRENQEAHLEAVPKEISVFVSDLEGFTGMAENLPANQLVQQLDEYFELVIPTVEIEFGGMVDKLLGDGILALFNTLDEQADHAMSACLAALSVIQKLQEVSKKRLKVGLPLLKARIGLASGTALVGNFGTKNRFSFSAAGEPVVIAARLEQMNKQFGTHCLASGEIRLATKKSFEWRALGEKFFFDHSVEIFELMGKRGEVEDHLLQARDFFERARQKIASGNPKKGDALLDQSLNLRPDDLAALTLKKTIVCPKK